jgi:hypothetical protein
MKKFTLLKIVIISLSFIFTSVNQANAASCSAAITSINQVLLKVDSALLSTDFDQVGEIVNELKTTAQSVLTASDNCDCDDGYYTAEEMLEEVNGAYLSDDIYEARSFLVSLKKQAFLAKKYVKSCGL